MRRGRGVEGCGGAPLPGIRRLCVARGGTARPYLCPPCTGTKAASNFIAWAMEGTDCGAPPYCSDSRLCALGRRPKRTSCGMYTVPACPAAVVPVADRWGCRVVGPVGVACGLLGSCSRGGWGGGVPGSLHGEGTVRCPGGGGVPAPSRARRGAPPSPRGGPRLLLRPPIPPRARHLPVASAGVWPPIPDTAQKQDNRSTHCRPHSQRQCCDHLYAE